MLYSAKHAYLIIAHNEPCLLQTLVSLIDDERNDIFITIDARADIKTFSGVKTAKSRLFFTRQCDNRWGSIKQVETEYVLFEVARSQGPYAYYHLLSGQDLPIKSQNYIHEFCDKLQGKEFVGFEQETSSSKKGVDDKTRYYYVLQRHFRCSSIIEKILVRLMQKPSIILQRILGMRRGYPYKLKKGCNWVSITDDFCRYLIEKKYEVLRLFNHTFCPDEIFLQTILWNSPFRKNIYDFQNEYHSSLRYIDWKRGKPYTWAEDDYDELMSSENDCLFARKFSSANMELIKKIVKKIKH